MNKRRLVMALVAFLALLILCTGVAVAATLIQRTVNVHYYDPLAAQVTPLIEQPLSVPYDGSSSLTYTVHNPTPATQHFEPSASGMPTGVTVSFSPASFDLTAGASRDVLVTVTCVGTPADSPITLNFTPS